MRVPHWADALTNSRAHWTRPPRGCGLKMSSRCVIAYIDHTLVHSRSLTVYQIARSSSSFQVHVAKEQLLTFSQRNEIFNV